MLMPLQISLYSAFLFVSAVTTLILAIYGWRNRDIPICQPFTLLMAAATVWTLGEAIQGMNIDLATSLVVNTIEYPGIVTVPVAWFILSLYYTGRERYITRKTLPLFFIVPAISIAFVATNQFHYLYYTSITPEIVNGIAIWHYAHGPLFQILILYSYLLAFLAFFLVIAQLFVHSEYYLRQTIILLIASSMPFTFNILYVLQPAGFPKFDITPFSFTVMGILIAVGIIRFGLFSTVPIAHTSLFRSMSDAVFVTGARDQVIDLNPAALKILENSQDKAIGITLDKLLPGLTGDGQNSGPEKEMRNEILISRNNRIFYYEIQNLPIYSRKSEIGHLIILHDISGRRTAQNALEAANVKLNLLSDITRHDIMNQLTILLGYLNFSKEKIIDPEILAFIGKEERSAMTIKQQIQFTSQYQDIGKQAPKWQNINESFRRASQSHTMGNITIRENEKNIDIYADPLFEKVFYNLIDNSLRYGGNTLKTIWISSLEYPDGLTIRYQDDGAGIPEADKPKLFTRGFGKTGGMGLFLVREILSITGITINETGIPGNGAQFEITVPKGAYRFE
jgi:signal transduction histidine kinase